MTKRQGPISDNGFIFKKINENQNIREKKILWAVLETISYIHFYPLGSALEQSQRHFQNKVH